MKKILFLCSLLLIITCKKETIIIDGSSALLFEESIEYISKKLPIYQQDRLKEAIQIIVKYDSPYDTEGIRWAKMRNKLNGKTVEQLFEWADKIAEEKGLKWNSKSSIVEFSLKNENNKSIKTHDYSIIKEVEKLKIQVRYYDSDNDQTIDGIMVYPTLSNLDNKIIEFDSLPIKSKIIIKNDGKEIYNKLLIFNSSKAGNINGKQGVFISFSMVKIDEIKEPIAEVFMAIELPNKSLSSKITAVGFDTTAYKLLKEANAGFIENTKLESTQKVQAFLSYLSDGNLKDAHSMSKNSKWKDFNLFKSPNIGFGNIKKLEIENVEFLKSNGNVVEVLATYNMIEKNDKNTKMKQLYTLQYVDGHWYIINSKIL